MYSLWHWPAFRATQLLQAANYTALTMETVLQSRAETIYGVTPGAYVYNDMLVTPRQTGPAMNFYLMHTPQVCLSIMYPTDCNATIACIPTNVTFVCRASSCSCFDELESHTQSSC